MEKGRREFLREVLTARLGPLPPWVLERLEQLSAEDLNSMTQAAMTVRSLRELWPEDSSS